MKIISRSVCALIVAGLAISSAQARADKGLKHDPEARAAAFVEKWDTNGDGKLDQAELAAAFKAIKERRAEHRSRHCKPRQ